MSAGAITGIPIGAQSTLVQTQRALVAESDASIIPKLIGALDDGRNVQHKIQNEHPEASAFYAAGVGIHANHKV